MTTIQFIAAILFGLALLHTFAAKSFERMAERSTKHSGLFHLLGEIEIVFGVWAFILIGFMAFVEGPESAIHYAETRQYAEPLFVFVIMVVAASRPILELVRQILGTLVRLVPINPVVAQVWMCLSVVPLIGSLITEPAAMTLSALLLAPLLFKQAVSERLKYAALGVLFVNVSIGGTLTSFAAPPVLMVASAWGWNSSYMLSTFGWKAVLAVTINATAITLALRGALKGVTAEKQETPDEKVPLFVSAVHLICLGAVVAGAHHPILFMGVFLFFLGFTHAYERYQNPLILKEGLLVGFFLAGLVVLGGMQQWWLQPVVASLEPKALFLGAMTLTAITDNAALTYLGSLIQGMTEQGKYMLVAGAVAGGGLTVIANAPNPAGVALLREGFSDGSIGIVGLLLGAFLPTIVAALCFLL